MAEKFRPEFHFTPRRNWCNDPNGLVWFDGEYHLFYQYNPFGDVWGHMSWGHAVSPDLLHWTELGVAIAEDAHNMIFSGSAVCDAENRSGLGAGDAPVLVAIYTGHRHGEPALQTQNLAFSEDRGRHWEKYAGNPVLDIGLPHFRDPKVFWHAATARWVMIVALSDRNLVSFYASADLKAWRHLSDFGPAGGGGSLWECPDLFALPVRGGVRAEKWLLKVDMFEGGVTGSAAAQYFIGEFDGIRFTPDKTAGGADLWGWADFGMDFYAAVTWSNLPARDGRPVWIGWMSAHLYASDLPTSPWRGAMSLPRSLWLEARPGGLALIQEPVSELASLRGEAIVVPARELGHGICWLASLAGFLAGVEFIACLVPLDSEQCGFELAWSSGDVFRLGYDQAAQVAFVDRSRAGLMSEDARFTGRRLAPFAAEDLSLRVILDRSSVEVFVDGGAVVFTELLFPNGELASLSFFVEAGKAAMSELTLWPLRLPPMPAG